MYTIKVLDCRLFDVLNVVKLKLKKTTVLNLGKCIASYILKYHDFDQILSIQKDDVEIWRLVITHRGTELSVTAKGGLDADGLTLHDGNPIKSKYLVLVDQKTNKNRFFLLEDLMNGTCQITHGRVGTTEKSTIAPVAMMPIKYIEKTINGYQDCSDEYNAGAQQIKIESQHSSGNSISTYKPMEDTDLDELLNYLFSVSRQLVKNNYLITLDRISPKMVQEASDMVELLSQGDAKDINGFNQILTRIFTILPRRMDQVSSHYAQNTGDFASIVGFEQNLIDNLKTQLSINENQQNKVFMTLADILGFSIEVDDSDDTRNFIERHLDNSQKKLLHRIYKIKMRKCHDRFEKYLVNEGIRYRNCRYLWHGSTNENWLSILKSGLLLKPDATITGKMFGNGLYFAPSSDKSFGYTSYCGSRWAGGNDNRAFMGLCSTAYGNPYFASYSDIVHDLDETSFKSRHPDCNCLHAKANTCGLRNDEIIFYNEAAVDIQYLVEFQS